MKVLTQSTSNTNSLFTRAHDVEIPEIYNRRFKSNKEGLDKIFGGGGFLPGMTFTMAAGPGTGKTTMMLQLLEELEKQGKKTGYISGEEGVTQLAFSCKRLMVQQVPLANITDIDVIIEQIKTLKLDFIVIDSMPTITVNEKLTKTEKEELIVTKLITAAKETECVIGVILHFTKAGHYKGGTLLPHSVDCNVLMRRVEDSPELREVEVTKNRFGCTGIAFFEMESYGFTFEEVLPAEEEKEEKIKKTPVADRIFSFVSTTSNVTADTVATELGISTLYAMNGLRDLAVKGSLIRTGKGPSATYSLGND